MTTILPAKQQFENAPAGSHLGICYGVIDLGTQLFKSQQFGDEACPGILFQFELPHELTQDGRPFSVSKTLKLKSGKKAAYRVFMESWRGVPFNDSDFGSFDAARVLGKAASLGITHETSERGTFSKISTVMPPMKGLAIPQPTNKLIHFTFDDFKQDVYDGLSDWLKAKIALSREYQQMKGVPQNDVPTEDSYGARLPDDEVPF